MSKRRQQVLNSSSEDEVDSDIESNKRVKPASSDSSTEGSDLDWTVDGSASVKQKKKFTAGGGGANPDTERGERNSSNSPGESWESGEDKSDDINREDSDSDSAGSLNSYYLSIEEEITSGENEFSDGLDSTLRGGPEDRAKLDQMTEAEREQEIYTRLELRERLQERKRIYLQLKRERRERSEKKRLRELFENSRRSDRKRKLTDIKRSEAIDQLKQNRQLQKEKQENEVISEEPDYPVKKASPKKKRQYTVKGVFGESGSETDGEYDDKQGLLENQDLGEGSEGEELEYGLKKSVRNLPISCVEEINKVRMSRFRLDNWVHMPYFNDVVVGSFVRIGIGSNEGKSIYRVAEVVEVVETPKVYSIINNPTNKGLMLKHGSQEKIFRMQYVSNADITKAEFDKWRSAVNCASLRLPTNIEIRKKLRAIEEAKSFVLNNEDIGLIVKEKERFRKLPTNYAMAKARLNAAKDIAEFDENFEEAQHLSERILEINERAEMLEKVRNKDLTRISFINERNRMHNLEREETIRIEMAERREDNPFTRRKCAPKLAPIAFLHNTSIGEGVETPEKAGTETTPQRLSGLLQTPVPTSGFKPSSQPDPVSGLLDRTLELNGNDTPNRTPNSCRIATNHSLNLSNAHDFDIPIDFPTDMTSSLPHMNILSSQQSNKGNHPRKNLNLSDYKKRKGLI